MRWLFSFPMVLALMLDGAAEAQEAIELFNQKDLNGWYAFQEEAGKHTEASDLFKVEDHMIRLFGPQAGYLMSEQAYKEFELTAEFRWNTDSAFVRKNDKKNSGLMYLVPESAPDSLWPQGIQFQIKEGATGDFILLQNFTLSVKGEQQGPGRSVVVKRLADAEKPVGEWNTLHIICKGGKITQELNGKVVNQGDKPSFKNGRILLQYEGYPIDFKKIEMTTF